MEITIKDGTKKRSGAAPATGITTTEQFLDALIITICVESQLKDKLTLEIDMTGLNREELMAKAIALMRCSNIAT